MAEITTGLELEISNSGLTFTNPNDSKIKLRAGLTNGELYIGDNSVNDNIVATLSNINSAITLDKANYVVLTNNNKVITTSALITLAKLNTLNDIDTSSTIQSQLNGKSPNEGNTNLVTVGTISTGAWEGSIIDVAHGGTGSNSLSNITVGKATSDAAGNEIQSTYATRVALDNVAKGKVHYAGHVDTVANLPSELTDTSIGAIYNVNDTGMDYMWVTLSGSGTSTDPYVYGWDQLGTLYKASSGISLSTIKVVGNEKYFEISNSGVRSVSTGTTSGTLSIDTNGSVTNVQVNGWSSKANLASPTFTGTPSAPTAAIGTNTTQIATTAYVKSEINSVLQASDALIFKGTIGEGGTITVLPSNHSCGDTYKVITAGTYAGVKCEVGDLIICIKNGTESADADWTVTQSNIDGAVTGPSSSVNNHIVIFDGSSGKLIKDSGKSLSNYASSTHTHTYTPSGIVSQPTFTGTAGTATASYTPSGSVSKPTFTGSESTVTSKLTPTGSISVTPTVTLNTTSVNSVTNVGSSPSLTGSYNATTKNLSVSWSAGSLPSTSSVSVATGVKSASATGSFTGNESTITMSFTPSGTVSKPTFTGTAATINSSYTPSGTVSQPTFTGSEGTTGTPS